MCAGQQQCTDRNICTTQNSFSLSPYHSAYGTLENCPHQFPNTLQYIVLCLKNNTEASRELDVPVDIGLWALEDTQARSEVVLLCSHNFIQCLQDCYILTDWDLCINNVSGDLAQLTEITICLYYFCEVILN